MATSSRSPRASPSTSDHQEIPPCPPMLTQREWGVWQSVEMEGLRPSELEKHTEWSASTIRTLLSRAREKLNE